MNYSLSTPGPLFFPEIKTSLGVSSSCERHAASCSNRGISTVCTIRSEYNPSSGPGFCFSLTTNTLQRFSRLRRRLAMDPDTQPPKRRDNVISSLNMAIEVLNIAKDVMSHTPAKAVFGSVSALLVMIRVYSFLLCVVEFPVHTCLGFDGQRSRLCRSRADLR